MTISFARPEKMVGNNQKLDQQFTFRYGNINGETRGKEKRGNPWRKAKDNNQARDLISAFSVKKCKSGRDCGSTLKTYPN